MTPQALRDAALDQARRVLVDVDATFELLLAALLVGGNVLIEGVPGTAKTLMARVLARLIAEGGDSADGAAAADGAWRRFRRIQFTPDLMPSDIVGTNVFNSATATFSLRPGPVFANVVVADEINRAPAKTQSALLEAMEEQQVTIEGETLPLPPVFMVMATQNPVEFEGTYPLPEAQVDRFLFKLLADYGSAEAERDIVLRHHQGRPSGGLDLSLVDPVLDLAGILAAREQVAGVRVDDSVADYLVAIGRGTRSAPEVQFGASVRGAISLLRASKAVAAFAGRDYVTPDDVKSVAPSVLRHRLMLKPEAELDGVRPDDVVKRLLGNLAVPR